MVGNSERLELDRVGPGGATTATKKVNAPKWGREERDDGAGQGRVCHGKAKRLTDESPRSITTTTTTTAATAAEAGTDSSNTHTIQHQSLATTWASAAAAAAAAAAAVAAGRRRPRHPRNERALNLAHAQTHYYFLFLTSCRVGDFVVEDLVVGRAHGETNALGVAVADVVADLDVCGERKQRCERVQGEHGPAQFVHKSMYSW